MQMTVQSWRDRHFLLAGWSWRRCTSCLLRAAAAGAAGLLEVHSSGIRAAAVVAGVSLSNTCKDTRRIFFEDDIDDTMSGKAARKSRNCSIEERTQQQGRVTFAIRSVSRRVRSMLDGAVYVVVPRVVVRSKYRKLYFVENLRAGK